MDLSDEMQKKKKERKKEREEIESEREKEKYKNYQRGNMCVKFYTPCE